MQSPSFRFPMLPGLLWLCIAVSLVASLALSPCLSLAQQPGADPARPSTQNAAPAGLTLVHVEGQVMAEGLPVEGALVSPLGTELGTRTNASGHFHVDLPVSTPPKLVIRALGYRPDTVTLEVEAGRVDPITVNLVADVFNLDEVVVAADRQTRSTRQAAVAVSVLNRQTLEATQALSLAEGLSFQPGLRVENNCQNCGFTAVRLNGLDGPYTQMLINGRPVYSALAAVYGLDLLPPTMIERVEVVRGGGSALYGAGAIAGVVNIVTREPLTSGFDVGGYTGVLPGGELDAVLRASADVVLPDQKTGVSLFAFHRNRQPYDRNGDGFSDLVSLDNTTFGLKLTHRPSLRSKLTLDLHRLAEYRRGGDQVDRAPHFAEIAEELRHSILGGGLTYEATSRNLRTQWSAYATGQVVDRASYYGGGQDPNAYGSTDDWTAVAGAQLSHRFPNLPGGPLTLTAGTEGNLNHVDDRMPAYQLPGEDARFDQDVANLGTYAQAEWVLQDRWRLVAGLRHDVVNVRNNNIAPEEPAAPQQRNRLFHTLNPRLALRAQLASWLGWRVSYARGFRAPQAFNEDLHISTAEGAVVLQRLGLGLRPETSHSFTTAFTHERQRGSWRYLLTAEGFLTLLNDPFVAEELDTNLAGTPITAINETRNGTGGYVAGGTAEAKLTRGERLSLQLGFTAQVGHYNDPLEVATGVFASNFLRLPSLYGYWVATWRPGRGASATLSGVYTGPMELLNRGGQDRVVRTPNFMEVNLRLGKRWQLTDLLALNLEAGVQNLFDQFQNDFDTGAERDAEYVYGPLRPRTVFVGLTLEGSR